MADAAQRDCGRFRGESGKNRARDFTHGKPSLLWWWVLFTGVFALTLFGIVKLVLHLAGI